MGQTPLDVDGLSTIHSRRAPLPEKSSLTDKTWVKQRENVYTIGIEFVKMAEKDAKIISEMADDFNDCDTRILLKLPEVCVGTCKCNKICNKIQKDETLFEDK